MDRGIARPAQRPVRGGARCPGNHCSDLFNLARSARRGPCANRTVQGALWNAWLPCVFNTVSEKARPRCSAWRRLVILRTGRRRARRCGQPTVGRSGPLSPDTGTFPASGAGLGSTERSGHTLVSRSHAGLALPRTSSVTLGGSLAFSRLRCGDHDIFTIDCAAVATEYDGAHEITPPAACRSGRSINGSWEIAIGGRGQGDRCQLRHLMWVPGPG